MINEYLNSEEYKHAIRVAQIAQKAYQNISPEAMKIFHETQERLSRLQKTIDELPGLKVLHETLQRVEKEVCENEGLSETEFEAKYSKQIEWYKQFGRNGWVITQYSNPADIKQWEEVLNNEGESGIAAFFEEEELTILDKITEELAEKYASGKLHRYFSKGLNAFEMEEYMTAAMYLFALLDVRLAELVDFPKRKMSNSEKYSNEGFQNQKDADYNRLKDSRSLITQKIYFLEMYPSLIEYLNRVFYDEPYPFWKKVEPPYLNRNWLMHGRMDRDVERFECIQMLNALSAMEFIFDEKWGDDNEEHKDS